MEKHEKWKKGKTKKGKNEKGKNKKIMPNFETRLNLRATTPSIESLIPIIAINNIRLKLEKSLGSNVK